MEERTVPSVSNLNITSITSTSDTDGGAGGAEHVTVVARSTVTVNFSYDSTTANTTTAKFDVNTSPTTMSTSFNTVPSGIGSSGTLSLVIPVGTVAGSYDAHVQVKNGSGGEAR